CGSRHSRPRGRADPGTNRQDRLPLGPDGRRESVSAIDAGPDHPLYRAWRLSFAPFVDVGTGPFTQPGLIPDWVVWIEGRVTLDPGAVGGDTVYYLTTPLDVDNHPDY